MKFSLPLLFFALMPDFLHAGTEHFDPEAIFRAIRATDCRSGSRERLAVMARLTQEADAVTPEAYQTFRRMDVGTPSAQLKEVYAAHPLFAFYDCAFQRVLEEVRDEQVPPGEVVLWHVYNMGYVVKTSRHCFGIDVCHRRGEELVPYLEFLLITHNHSDHYTRRLACAMDKAKKTVYSNFFPNYGGYSKEPFREIRYGELTLRTFESDHNKFLPKFVMPFEIVCGPDADDCVIFSGGDTCDARQLHPVSARVDFFLVHPRVGLKVEEALQTVRPQVTLISHLLELSHPRDRWRWTPADGIEEAEKVRRAGGTAWIPLWGERIRWRKK